MRPVGSSRLARVVEAGQARVGLSRLASRTFGGPFPGETVSVEQILIVDDDIDFREGLQLVLSDFCDSVMTTDNDAQAAALAASLAPEVVLIDPEGSGLETARQIKAHAPRTGLILLSVFDRYLSTALDVGADGYLLKGCPTEELVAAITRPAGSNPTT